MGFDWSDYVRRREGLGNHAIVALTDAEADAFRRGDYPPPPSGMQRPAGMGEQPSIINRDPGDENRAQVPCLPYPGLATYPPLGSDAQRILALEAEVALLRADLARLMATPPAPSTAPTPPPHNPMTNALAHSEPKPVWLR